MAKKQKLCYNSAENLFRKKGFTMVFLIILIVLILLYVFLLIPRLPRRDMSALTKVDYAHRGLWNAQRPENSLSAFRSAVLSLIHI